MASYHAGMNDRAHQASSPDYVYSSFLHLYMNTLFSFVAFVLHRFFLNRPLRLFLLSVSFFTSFMVAPVLFYDRRAVQILFPIISPGLNGSHTKIRAHRILIKIKCQ